MVEMADLGLTMIKKGYEKAAKMYTADPPVHDHYIGEVLLPFLKTVAD